MIVNQRIRNILQGQAFHPALSLKVELDLKSTPLLAHNPGDAQNIWAKSLEQPFDGIGALQ